MDYRNKPLFRNMFSILDQTQRIDPLLSDNSNIQSQIIFHSDRMSYMNYLPRQSVQNYSRHRRHSSNKFLSPVP